MVPAILGTARLNNFRLNYVPADLYRVRSGKVTIWLAGALAHQRIRRNRLSIRDVLNDAPNSCALVVEGAAPQPGQDLRVSVNSNDPRLLFNGTLQTVDASYEGRPVQLVWSCNAVDDTARANRLRPFGNWFDTSATVIAQQITAQFAPGLTSKHVQANLPTVSITFDGTETFGGALKRLAGLVGGYCYIEDLDVHLFLTEATDAPDPIDTTPGRFLDTPPIMKNVDDSQLHTRVYGKGHGEAALCDVGAGDTLIPIASAVMFNAAGGQAIAGTTPDGAQSQRLRYTGTQPGGVGTLVGPGVAPSAAPTATPVAGAGLTPAATYQYAYTFVTASGESRPGPTVSVRTSAAVPRAVDPTEACIAGLTNYAAYNANGRPGLDVGVVYQYYYTYQLRSNQGETLWSPPSQPLVPHQNGGDFRAIDVWYPLPTEEALRVPGAAIVCIYRSRAGGPFEFVWYVDVTNAYPGGYHLSWRDNNEPPQGPAGPYPEYPLNAAILPTANQIALAGIGIGPTGTTARKVYRTAANGAQLKLQQTIAGNVATTGVQDASADASLGANAPVADTSGLSTVTGQVNAGATSLPTANATPFVSTGGYVTLGGGQVVRYTGITGNNLTGIPATGPGAIVTTVPFGSAVVAAPALVGVTGIAQKILTGAQVAIWVQRDNVAAQQARAALDAAQGRTSDGVVEHVLVDERRGEPSLIALCDADLALFAYPIVTVTYDTRDLKTKSGKPVTFDLPSPDIVGTLTIQDVTISEIDIAAGLPPRFHAVASSVRYSLEDILRQLLTEASAV